MDIQDYQIQRDEELNFTSETVRGAFFHYLNISYPKLVLLKSLRNISYDGPRHVACLPALLFIYYHYDAF